MRTNLSKWTCVFSDHPWPDVAEEFPYGRDVQAYLESYAKKFSIHKYINYDHRVDFIEKVSRGFSVSFTHNGKNCADIFENVIVASGVFAKRSQPQLTGIKNFKGDSLHSGEYKYANMIKGQRVAVVGGSMSGVEIASHLAEAGREVILVMDRPVWILPHYYVDSNSGANIPLDLFLYSRRNLASPTQSVLDEKEKHIKSATFLENTFGNPGDTHEALRTHIDGTPPYSAISDNFLRHVKSGKIAPVIGKVDFACEGGIAIASGEKFSVDALLFCTGFSIDLSFLDERSQAAIAYRPDDKLVPYLADKTVIHPKLDGMYFVGLYRGPYFGIIELQARWAALLIAREVVPPSKKKQILNIEKESLIRNAIPRPQFPHGNYVEFADSIATEIGAIPDCGLDASMVGAIASGPVVPGQYRLCGPYANKTEAAYAIEAACARAGVLI